MRLHVHRSAEDAIRAAADCLTVWLTDLPTPTLMVAAGNTPLPLYAEIARRELQLDGLRVFVLDEYVGVPESDPRTCTNLLRNAVKQAWRVADERFLGLCPEESQALASVLEHERRVVDAGGLDAIVLGLGVNGHLGFNEPGSSRDSQARLVALQPASVEANRDWFSGEHAPRLGATVGLSTILAARRVMLLAFGARKADAVRSLLRDGSGETCPAAWLREHAWADIFVDEAAATKLRAT